ncbi:MAG TPA: tRNA pseudouridine(54/55) synthase Pus10 [archaeon]|nr:tRNA pseudouridine(54/55) synthase Pus10 [archaeon]
MDLKDKVVGRVSAILKEHYVCDACLGRTTSQLLSGFTNEDRGKIIRTHVAMLIDSGEGIEISKENMHGYKFRNSKMETAKPDKCYICKGLFTEGIDGLAMKIIGRLKGFEFETFLVGSVLSDELLNVENKVWETVGAEFVESMKSEINREVGKKLENITGKKADLKNPDISVIIDLKNDRISLSIRSLFIIGGYKKLARGIPQTRWICNECGGKGCIKCKGKGQLYPTSVQEIIEKPFLKSTDGKKSSFHGAGREDRDARCLDWRPFVIEIIKPVNRNIDLKTIQKQLNKNKKVNVNNLKILDNGRDEVRRIKTDRLDKTYSAEVTFSKNIDKKKLKGLKSLATGTILQKTPKRVLHRRADMFRRRAVKEISWKAVSGKKIIINVKGESGLYIKELMHGDEGRTKPSVAEILDNKVKNIKLDVVKIHTK